MSVRSFFAVLAIIALAFGTGDVFLARMLNALYGLEPSHAVRLVTRWLGGSLIGLGLVIWFARDFDPIARRLVLIAVLVSSAVGFIVSVFGVMSQAMNDLGWSIVAIFLFAAVGSAWLLRQPNA